MILITAVGYPFSGNRMNLIQTHSVGHLASTLGWDRAGPAAVAAAVAAAG